VFSRITGTAGKKLFLATLIAAPVLTGCEARLDLSGVDKTLSESVRRTDQLMAIERFGDGSDVVLGNNGLVLTRASDVGVWQRQQVGEDMAHPNFIDSSQCADGSVVALAYEGQVWRSVDKGLSWSHSELPTEEEVQAIACTPAGDLWVVGSYSTLLVSHDQGESWTDTTMDEDAMLTQVQFVSASEGFAVGEFGLFLMTEDGGETWEIQEPIGDEMYPLSAYFSDRNTGWVGGLQGVIMYTDDGGLSWQRQQVQSDVPIYNFIANGSMYATGDRGTVLKLKGNHWDKVAAPEIPTYYRSGVVSGKDSLLIVGGWGVMLPLDLASAP